MERGERNDGQEEAAVDIFMMKKTKSFAPTVREEERDLYQGEAEINKVPTPACTDSFNLSSRFLFIISLLTQSISIHPCDLCNTCSFMLIGIYTPRPHTLYRYMLYSRYSYIIQGC